MLGKELKKQPNTKQILRNIKGNLKSHDFVSLKANLYSLCNTQLQQQQLNYFVKLIQILCVRLDSTLKIVDSFVFVVKCLSSSTRCASEIYSEQEFQNYLTSIRQLTKKEEISQWIRSTRSYILETKKSVAFSESASHLVAEARIQLKKLKDYIQPMAKKFQVEGATSEEQLRSIQSKIKQLMIQAECKQPHIVRQIQDQFQSPKKLEKVAVIRKQEQLPGSLHKAFSSEQGRSPYGFKQSEQNDFQLFRSENAPIDNTRLIKSMLGVRNENNLNFLKKNLWEICGVELRSVQEAYSSEHISKGNLHAAIDHKPNLLLIIQLINGIVLGGFTQEGIKPGCHSAKGFLFSLSRKEVFPRVAGSVVTYHPEYIIFGKEELKIKEKQMLLQSNFGEKDYCFDCKNKDINYFIGEGNRRDANIFKYVIYQIL